MNRKVDRGGLFMEQREEVNIKEIPVSYTHLTLLTRSDV